MSNSMTYTEMVVILIGGGIIAILLLAGLLTMLPGFVYWVFGKKETGDRLVKFGAACGMMAFSLMLMAAVWIQCSWIWLIMLVIMLVADWVMIFKQIKKKKELKAEQKQ